MRCARTRLHSRGVRFLRPGVGSAFNALGMHAARSSRSAAYRRPGGSAEPRALDMKFSSPRARAATRLISPEHATPVAPFVESELERLWRSRPRTPLTPHRITGESRIHLRLEIAERAGLTPFAGRSRELKTLEELLADAMAGDGGFAVVLGDPGAGKSRLLLELRRHVERTEARLVIGRCDAYGKTTPYSPFVQALRELLGLGAAAGAVTAAQVAERVRAVDASLEDALPLYCALLSVESAAHPLPRHLQGDCEGRHARGARALITSSRVTAPGAPPRDWHGRRRSRRALERSPRSPPEHPLLVVVSCRRRARPWERTDGLP